MAVSNITVVSGFLKNISRRGPSYFMESRKRRVNSSTRLARSMKSSLSCALFFARSWSFSVTWKTKSGKESTSVELTDCSGCKRVRSLPNIYEQVHVLEMGNFLLGPLASILNSTGYIYWNSSSFRDLKTNTICQWLWEFHDLQENTAYIYLSQPNHKIKITETYLNSRQ